MGKINVLSFAVANLIAAGEVVDRPSSVIKELLENSIDSGATRITVEIQNGGVTLMRVSDDGCGMSPDDLPVAIRRHATSKIKNADDLDGIMTLGFRGEALAAIAAVSDLRIISKTHDAEFGAMLSASGGDILGVNERGCPDGTTVIVENLFKNVPARRKFLKRDVTEAMAVTAVVEKIALSHPEIAFKFICDGNVKIETAGDGKLKNTIYSVFGREYVSKMIEVVGDAEGISVSGYIGRSDNVRANRNYQNVFINGRYIKSKTVSAALEQAYTSYVPPEKFPCCVLFLNINPQAVDVNVHPAKLEVKFSNEKPVFEAVYYTVRTALENNISRPDIKFGRQTPSAVNAFVPIETEKNTSVKKRQLSCDDIKPFDPEKNLTAQFPESFNNDERPSSGSETDNDDRIGVGVVSAAETLYIPNCDRYENQQPTEENVTKNVEDNQSPASIENIEANKGAEEPPLPEPPPGYPDRPISYMEDLLPASDRAYVESIPRAEDIPHESMTSPAENMQDADNALKTSHKDIEKPESSIAYIPEAPGTGITAGSDDNADAQSESSDPPYRMIGEVFHTYVLVEKGDVLLLIDKHAAHERIIFEGLKASLHKAEHTSQILMLPIEVMLASDEVMVIDQYRAELGAIGFEVSCGKYTVSVSAIPAGIDAAAVPDMITVIADRLKNATGNAKLTRDIAFEKALYQASCKAAIKAGIDYPDAHLQWIVDRLMEIPDITVCPHGRPVAMQLSKKSLDRQFERT